MPALVNIITGSRIRGTIISNNLDKMVIVILYGERLMGFEGLVPLRKVGVRREQSLSSFRM